MDANAILPRCCPAKQKTQAPRTFHSSFIPSSIDTTREAQSVLLHRETENGNHVCKFKHLSTNDYYLGTCRDSRGLSILIHQSPKGPCRHRSLSNGNDSCIRTRPEGILSSTGNCSGVSRLRNAGSAVIGAIGCPISRGIVRAHLVMDSFFRRVLHFSHSPSTFF